MQMIKNADKRIYLYIVIVIYGILCTALCFNHNIWTDEAFTLQVVRENETLSSVWNFIIGDSHPPLYYLMVKLVTSIFGESLFVFKVFSIIPVLITMGLGPVVLYRKLGFKTALLFEMLLATVPCLMEYSIQPRMYTWAMLFVTLCGFYAYKTVFLSPKLIDWILFAIFGTLSAYTHYFAFAAVLWIYGIAFIFILLRKTKGHFIKWIGVCLLSLILYIPWFAAMADQVKNGDENWIDPTINLRTIRGYFNWLIDIDVPGQIVVFGIIFIVALILCCMNFRNEATNIALLSLAIPVLIVITGVLLSILIRPIFVMRYIVPSAGLLCLSLAIGYSYLSNRAYVMLTVFWLLVGAIIYKQTWFDEYNATRTPMTEEFFNQNFKEGDVVAYNWKVYRFAYEYYFDSERLIYIEDIDWDSPDLGTVWLLDTSMNVEPDAELLSAMGWREENVGAFGIELNDFDIIKISR